MTPDDLLLEGFHAWWITRNRGAKTIKNYLSSLRRFSAWLDGEGRGRLLVKPTEAAARARRADVDVWLLKRLSDVEPVTVHGDYKALRAFYGWLVDVEEETKHNPMDKVQPPQVPETERYSATEADYVAMLRVCDRNPNKVRGRRDAAILALLWSGMRRGEICVLDVGDVEPIEGDLTIRYTKSHRPRHVTLMDTDMVLRLQRWLRTRPENRQDPTALFVGTKGRLNPDAITGIFAKIRDQAGLAQVTPHAFRRGRTVIMLDDEIDGSLIMAHMGWTSERMKARYARERTEELAKKAIKRKYRTS